MKNKNYLSSYIAPPFILTFLFFINYTTSWGHPWIIYPTFAILWWPLAVICSRNKNVVAFSIVGSAWISIFAISVNLITSPGYFWCIFPIFVVWWWPLSLILCGAKKYRLYSVLASIYTIAFFYLVNLISSPNVTWFIYPAFAILWWPIAMFYNKNTVALSIISSILVSAFMIVVNLLTSPSYLWCIFPIFVVWWWPLSLSLARVKKYKLLAIIGSIYTIAFFYLVNLISSPNVTWFIYPAYAIIWWPLSMFFIKKSTIKLYSIIMSFTTLVFLILINYFMNPSYIWVQHTIFYFLWWPLITCLGKKAKTLTFSIIGAIVIIAYYVTNYFILTPGIHPWYLYIILPVIWWPVCMAFKDKVFNIKFLFLSLSIFTIYYTTLNLIFSPNYLWVLYLLYLFSWIVMGLYFYRRNKIFTFSILAAVITILFFSVINYMESPHQIWAVYPSFAILWWPLSQYYYGKRKTMDAEQISE